MSKFLITIALQSASVGSVLVILASNPMFSGILSYFLLGEVMKKPTVLAAVVCFTAIIVIFVSELSRSGQGVASLGGMACALVATIALSLYLVLLRLAEKKYRVEADSLVCCVIAGLVGTIMSLVLAEGQLHSEVITSSDWMLLALNGILVLPLSSLLLTASLKHISAPEASLCTLLETALSPLWVYLGGYERPSFYAIGGGAALITAL
eukprot:gene42972-52519_t